MPAARKQVRGDRLIAGVMKAALAEIGRVGLEQLSIEVVADRARVNKTTIYRRWPTPEALALAALSCAAEAHGFAPDTGTLPGDLRAFAEQFRSAARLPEMKTVMRLRWSGGAKGPLASITRGLQERKLAEWKRMLARAVARGELAADADIGLVRDVMVGVLLYLVVLSPRPSSSARLSHALELVLRGALHAPRRSATTGPPRQAGSRPARPRHKATPTLR
jgi:AcrR family transcriptional regulator